MMSSNELQELLASVQLQKFFDLLEDELKITTTAQLLKRLKSSDLSQIGMTKCEVERLKKCAKSNGNQSALSKLRKILPGKNDSSNGTNGSKSIIRRHSNIAANNGLSATSSNSKDQALNNIWLQTSIEYQHSSPTPSPHTPPPTFTTRVNQQPGRELCKRSLSNTMADRPRQLDHLHRHRHELIHQSSVCCKFDSQHPCEHYIDLPPSKIDSLIPGDKTVQKPPSIGADRKIERTPSCEGCTTPIGEVLKTLSGPQDVKLTDSPQPNEKAPLIQTDPPRVGGPGATTTFDNIAAVTETDPGAAGRETPPRRTNHLRTVSESDSSETLDRRGSPESAIAAKMGREFPKKKKVPTATLR